MALENFFRQVSLRKINFFFASNLSYFYPCGSNGIRIHNTVFSLTFKSQPSMQTAEMVEFGKEFLIWIRKINSDPNVLGSARLTNNKKYFRPTQILVGRVEG